MQYRVYLLWSLLNGISDQKDATCASRSQSIPRLLCFLIVASIQIMYSWDNGLLRSSLASCVCDANVKGHAEVLQSVQLYYYQQLSTALWNSSGQLEPQILLSSVTPGYSVPVSLALCVFEPGGVSRSWVFQMERKG